MAKKKLTKKQKRQLARLVLACLAFILVISIPVGLIVFFTNSADGATFKTVDRVKHINKEKKKEKDAKGYATIGWLRVQGTNIDAPIIKYDSMEGMEEVNKDDFLWNEYPVEKIQKRVNIQGHNILNLSAKPEVGLDYFTRFENLMSFVYIDFAKENQYIQYTVDGKNYLYQIFAVYFDEVYNLDLYNPNEYSDEEVEAFIQRSLDKSLYKYDVEVNKDEKVISLITCTRMYGNDKKQFLVVGKMIDSNSKTTNYKVEENSNYKEVKNLMKGVDENVEM